MKKEVFERAFIKLCEKLQAQISDATNKWTIKGFIDINQNIFTIFATV